MNCITDGTWRGELIKNAVAHLPETVLLHEPTNKCNGKVKYLTGDWHGRNPTSPIVKLHCDCDWIDVHWIDVQKKAE